MHSCLPAGVQDHWRLDGPDGASEQVRVRGAVRSNSAEFTREALMAGVGIALRSSWEVGPELRSGKLKVVLPEYRGASSDAIYAVYPSRDFMPAKVNALIEFLIGLYGPEPYWNAPQRQAAE